MSKYQAYPEYKETEVLGFNQIPSNWNILKVKYLFNIGRGRVIAEQELEQDGKYPVYSSQTKNDGVLGYINSYDFDCEQLTWTTDGANAGTVFLRRGKHNCTNVCGTLQPKSADVSMRFALYCLRYATQFHKRPDTNGAKIMNNEMANIDVTVPSLCEREKITNFLDHETAKIDTLIDKQQQLIQLLKEKRQAVISHAVTKGLNPNAPMRDSGVEWLGAVPEHWSVVPIKRVCEVKDGTHDTPQYVDPSDEAFPLITSKDFDGNNISFEDAKYISKADYLEIIKRSNTEVGDVLMSMIGGNIGKALIVKNHANFSIKNVALFKAGKCEYLANYILYYLQSGLLDVQISLLSRGGAQGFLSLGDLRNLVFFKIPECELEGIVTTLNRQVVKFDDLIVKAQSVIQFMQERRTALISAAVTGKIDVRHHASRPAGNDTSEFSA